MTRIYEVKIQGEQIGNVKSQMVRATSARQAMRHVYMSFISAEVATPERCIELTKGGVEVEVAG